MVLSGVDMPLDAVKRQIASAVDLLVHLERQPDRSRKVMEIAEVDGMKNGEIVLHTLFSFDREKGRLVRTGTLRHPEKLMRAGITL